MKRFTRRRTSDMEAAHQTSSSTPPINVAAGSDEAVDLPSSTTSHAQSMAGFNTDSQHPGATSPPPTRPPRVVTPTTAMNAGKSWWWPWKNVFIAFGVALVLSVTVKGFGSFTNMEDNGFALVAATAPGSHWGNWRSMTRCDCKAFQQCTAALAKAKTLSATRVGRFIQLATCQLATGQDEDCQLHDKELKRGLTRFRFFFPDLVLRLRLAADFRWWVRLGCYFLMSCALLEIIFYLVETTRLRWHRRRTLGEDPGSWWEKEISVWLFLVVWHEALSYLVHYVYSDSHTMCDGVGLFFRDAMALYTLIQVFTRAVVKRGPNAHRAWLLQAEQKYLALQHRPWWVQVVRDPRVGAFHTFSGVELKITEDPVGFVSNLVLTLTSIAKKVLSWLPSDVQALVPGLGGGRPVEGSSSYGSSGGRDTSKDE